MNGRVRFVTAEVFPATAPDAGLKSIFGNVCIAAVASKATVVLVGRLRVYLARYLPATNQRPARATNADRPTQADHNLPPGAHQQVSLTNAAQMTFTAAIHANPHIAIGPARTTNRKNIGSAISNFPSGRDLFENVAVGLALCIAS